REASKSGRRNTKNTRRRKKMAELFFDRKSLFKLGAVAEHLVEVCFYVAQILLTLRGFERVHFQAHIGAVHFEILKKQPVGFLQNDGIVFFIKLHKFFSQVGSAEVFKVHTKKRQFVQHVEAAKIVVEFDAVKNDRRFVQKNIAAVQVAVPVNKKA